MTHAPAGLAAPRAARAARHRLWWCLMGATALLLSLDQFVKWVIATSLPRGEVMAISAWFNLVHVLNPGASFSFLADAGGWQRWFFIALATGISAWLALALLKPRQPLETTGYCLILGGALGNLTDRVFRGYVVDSLDFHWAGWHWPAFNLADLAITLGVGIFLAAGSVCRSPRHGATN